MEKHAQNTAQFDQFNAICNKHHLVQKSLLQLQNHVIDLVHSSWELNKSEQFQEVNTRNGLKSNQAGETANDIENKSLTEVWLGDLHEFVVLFSLCVLSGSDEH